MKKVKGWKVAKLATYFDISTKTVKRWIWATQGKWKTVKPVPLTKDDYFYSAKGGRLYIREEAVRRIADRYKIAYAFHKSPRKRQVTNTNPRSTEMHAL